MRITYIHQHFRLPSQAGGTRSWEFARRLAAEGHEVTIIGAAGTASRVRIDGVQILLLNSRYSNNFGFVRRLVAFADFMIRSTFHAARLPADVVFATSTPLTVIVPGFLASFFQRARLVFEVRDLWPSVPVEMGYLKNPVLIAIGRAMERFSYSRASAVVALSPDMARGVRDVNPSVRVVVVPNACDFELFAVPPGRRIDLGPFSRETSGPKRLVYAGSLGSSYDPAWLSRFAIELRRAGVDFLIAGEGSGRAVIESELKAAGIDPSAVLIGAIPKSSMVQLLASADATVSSLADFKCLEANSLNKVFDSLAASRPVILNHGGWLTDALLAEGAGIRVARDAASAAKEVLGWLESADLSGASTAARELGAARFDRDRLFEEFREALL